MQRSEKLHVLETDITSSYSITSVARSRIDGGIAKAERLGSLEIYDISNNPQPQRRTRNVTA